MSLTDLVFASVVANLGLSLAQDVKHERLLAGVMGRASVGPVGDVRPVVEEGLLAGSNGPFRHAARGAGAPSVGAGVADSPVPIRGPWWCGRMAVLIIIVDLGKRLVGMRVEA